MNEQHKPAWQMNRRDILFLGIIAAVILLLVLGTTERTTRPVPDDDVHLHSTSRAACMQCHGPQGVRPQPAGHTRADQCFQCHQQPEGWQGMSR